MSTLYAILWAKQETKAYYNIKNIVAYKRCKGIKVLIRPRKETSVNLDKSAEIINIIFVALFKLHVYGNAICTCNILLSVEKSARLGS